MKALTLKQPWAYHVALGEKRIENRSWAPPESIHGELLAIHAGKGWDRECSVSGPTREALTFGSVIALVRVSCIVRSLEEAERLGQGGWFVGPIGWVLEDVRPVAPVPAKGRQGLWNLPPEVEAQVLSNLESIAKARALDPSGD